MTWKEIGEGSDNGAGGYADRETSVRMGKADDCEGGEAVG